MTKKFIVFIGTGVIAAGLVGCSAIETETRGQGDEIDSEETLSDQIAKEEGVLSEDDAEVLIYNELSEEEKQTHTVDFLKEEETKYYIRVYERENEEKTRTYTVDLNTDEVKLVK